MSTKREAAYDEHIAPLMSRVIAHCKEHKIPLLSCFDLAGEDDEREGEAADTLRCTTCLHGPDWPLRPEFEKALVHFLPPEPTFMTFITVTKGKIDEP